jgi:hypothetical protein
MIAAIIAFQRFHVAHGVSGEIGERQNAPAFAASRDHRLCNRPFVERIGTVFGNSPERAGKVGLNHAVARMPGRPRV